MQSVDGTPTPTWQDMVTQGRGAVRAGRVRGRSGGGETLTLTVDVGAGVVQANGKVGAIGASASALPPAVNTTARSTGSVARSSFTGEMFVGVWNGLLAFPEKIPKVIEAIGGAERDPDTPVSVVGASIIGGDAVERGLWEMFLLLLATLNFFVGVFNLLPLLPLDGGHIAVLFYEKIRDWLRAAARQAGRWARRLHRSCPPVTMVFVLIGGAVMLADRHSRHREPDPNS